MATVQIPLDALSPEALRGLVEEFVSREGTDYSHADYTLEQKCQRVMQQLERAEALVLFDTELNTSNIALARDVESHE